MGRKLVAGIVGLVLALAGVVGMPQVARAAAGTGPWVALPAPDQAWESIAYGAGLFVAVSFDGDDQVMTSPDGRTWTLRSTPGTGAAWMSVTFGGGRFVAVSSSGEVMSSSDGITWSLATAPVEQWSSVAYGAGTYVAVGNADYVITSSDGATWTVGGTVEDTTWRSVTFGEGTFVAVADFGTDQVITSPDGLTWTAASTQPEVSEWVSVTYGGDQFVAVACVCDPAQKEAAYSSDGQNWTAVDAPTAEWSSVTYGLGLYVAVAEGDAGTGADQVMTSTNGQTWTSSTDTPANLWTSVAFGGGVFAAVSPTDSPEHVMISYTPTIASVSPTSGPTSAGTSVTITGTNLLDATGVTFGGVAGTGLTINSSTQLTVVAPAGSGLVDVVVTTSGGEITRSGAFRFIPAPVIGVVSPRLGPNTGGTSVVITGSNLITASSVTFGGTSATFSIDTGGTVAVIVATTPAHAAGAVNVVVSSPSGTSTANSAFTYTVPTPTPTPTPTPVPRPTTTPTPTQTPTPAPIPSPPVLHQESLLVRFAEDSARLSALQRTRIRNFVDLQPGEILNVRIVGYPAEDNRRERRLALGRANVVNRDLRVRGVDVLPSALLITGNGDISTFPGRAGSVYLTVWSVT